MKIAAALGALVLLAAPQLAPWDQPTLTTAPAELYSIKDGDQRTGSLYYAGGLYLTSSSSRLGGLSGLEAQTTDDGGVLFSAVSDAGDFFQFKGRLDDAGRLIGAADLKMAQLRDDRGRPFQTKAEGDAEDISLLPDRPGYLVSFERRHRIVAYEDPLRANAAQTRVDIPVPVKKMRANSGIEAVAALPGGLVAEGVEDGRIWMCPRGQQCVLVTDKVGMIAIGPSYSLSSLDAIGDGDLIALYRARAPLAHWNAKIVHIRLVEGKARMTVLADLRAYLGNMEGIAAVPLEGGVGWRLYLVSDNAFEPREPTLLLAFDWRP